MADDPKTYPLEPTPGARVEPPAVPQSASGAHASPDAAPASIAPTIPIAAAPAAASPAAVEVAKPGRPKLVAPGLLSDFPEGADFDRDPVREAIVRGPRIERASESTELGPPLVASGLGGAQAWAIVGGALLVGAAVATAINAPNRAVIRVLLVMYNALLHTGTGVAALTLAAMLLQRRMGPIELAGTRMFTAVSAFALVVALPTRLFGTQWADASVGIILGAVVYVMAVAALFGLWKRVPLGYVVCGHAILWLIVQVGVELGARAAGGT